MRLVRCRDFQKFSSTISVLASVVIILSSVVKWSTDLLASCCAISRDPVARSQSATGMHHAASSDERWCFDWSCLSAADTRHSRRMVRNLRAANDSSSKRWHVLRSSAALWLFRSWWLSGAGASRIWGSSWGPHSKEVPCCVGKWGLKPSNNLRG